MFCYSWHCYDSGLANGGEGGGAISSSCDRLIYVMACLIGQPVEVHVRNGSVISGIFHASNAAKDFGTCYLGWFFLFFIFYFYFCISQAL